MDSQSATTLIFLRFLPNFKFMLTDSFSAAEDSNAEKTLENDVVIHDNKDTNDLGDDFTDVKNEAKFCLESNYNVDENEVSCTHSSEGWIFKYFHLCLC